MHLAASDHLERVTDVTLMVFDDSCLPPRSCIGVVLHSAFALRLPKWMREAARTDGVSQSFSQNLSSDAHFIVPPNLSSEPADGPAPPPVETTAMR